MIWTPENIDIVKSYLQKGLNSRNIALKLNTSLDSVSHAIRAYNLGQYRTQSAVIQKMVKNIDLEELNDAEFDKLKEKAKLQWKVKKSTLSPSKHPYKIGLITSDHHCPHHDIPCVKAILKLMDDIKFDRQIILGDFLDYGCISHWNQAKHRTLEMQRLKKDYIIGNSILDEMDKRLPKTCEKHFFKGNHELWVDDLLEQMPQLEGLIEPESQLFLKERGYKVYPYNDIVPFGRLNLTHGIYATTNSVKKHLDELKVNIMFGHTHTEATMLSSSPARQIAFAGYNVGCLCNMAPDYMKNRPHAWTHGFAVVYFYDNGYFDVNIVRIVGGKFIYNGKIYDGNK